MSIVAICQLKGGSGKSTLSTNLAAELMARGRSVVLVDADPQGTARTWADVAAEEGHEVPTVVAMGKGLHKASGVPALAQRFDVVVIDTPPRMGEVMRAALVVADVALLPSSGSPADVWALGPTLEVLEEAQMLRPALQAAIVLTRIRRTALGSGAREALTESALPVFGAELGMRTAFEEALGAGLGVTSYDRTSKAADEFRSLVDELEMMEGTIHAREATA